jgi:DNA-binding winged helix-turn-helix (wHTH) protein/predicted ATPase
MICFGSYRLHPVQGLTMAGQEVRITAKSLAVLRFLAERAGQVVTKEELFRGVWVDTAVSDAALTSCIKELRRALEDDARSPTFIETLHRRGYRFLPAVSAAAAGARASTSTDAIVGRKAVIDDLVGSFALASRGLRQLLLIAGDAGIGKSTVVRGAVERVAESYESRVAWGLCVEHYGVGEPYQPLLEALTQLSQQPGGHQVVAVLEQYGPTWLAQIPALVAPERRDTTRRSAAGVTPARMQRELTNTLEALAVDQPLLLCLEDLHWSDASTLDWLAGFARRPDPARVLIIGTVRPSDLSGTGQLAGLMGELLVKGLCREIALQGLDEPAVLEYSGRRFPPIPASRADWPVLASLVHRHTEGNPLFVANVLGDLASREVLVRKEEGWCLTREFSRIDLGIPDDLRRMIDRRLDRLGQEERTVLEAASTCGQLFSAAAAAAGAAFTAARTEAVLAGLARHHRFVRGAAAVEWPDGTIASGFEFLHALYRTVLYEGLPAGRRAEAHRRIGARLEEAFGGRAREIAAELSRHFEEARDVARALVFRQHAAEHARSRSAYPEARLHYAKALDLLRASDVADCVEREVVLRTGLGGVVMATEGWGSANAETAFSRARSLSQQLGDASRLFPALWGLWLYYWGRGPLETAQELAEQLLELAGRSNEPSALLQGHHALWATEFSRGRLEHAVQHAREGLALYDGGRDAMLAATFGNHDAGVCGRLFLGRALALRGESESAVRVVGEGVDAARALDHPFTLTLAHVFAAAVSQTLRDPATTGDHAAEACAIARDQDFRLLFAWATAFEGWAQAGTGHHEAGIQALLKSVAQVRSTGSEQFLPHILGLLADACLAAGRTEDAAAAVRDAFGVVERTGERFYEAELRRLEGDAQRARHADDKAAAAYREALRIAGSQGAHLLRLRAAIGLAAARDAKTRAEADVVLRDALAAVPEPLPRVDARQVGPRS